jgi:hypothetical protein
MAGRQRGFSAAYGRTAEIDPPGEAMPLTVRGQTQEGGGGVVAAGQRVHFTPAQDGLERHAATTRGPTVSCA